MKLKKLLISSMLGATACLALLGATACDLLHKHTFSEGEILSAPTCTSVGLQKKTCKCGEVEYVITEALNHTPVIEAGVEATCTEFGKTVGCYCSECGYVFTAQEFIAPLGHNCDEMTVVEEAVCNADGIKRYTCSNEGCSYSYDETYSLAEMDSAEIYASAMQYTGTLYCLGYWGEVIEIVAATIIGEGGVIVASSLYMEGAYSAFFHYNGEYYDVTKVLAHSDKSKLTVLQIEADNLPCANLCKNDPVNGETVYTAGYLGGQFPSISRGVISNAKVAGVEADCIQHDADMDDGYMGGPLLNRFGEVIGINVGYYDDAKLKMSVYVSELDKLDYSSPMSIEEYGRLTYTPLAQLRDWSLANQNGEINGVPGYLLEGENFFYALTYYEESECNVLVGCWRQENLELCVEIIFNNTTGTYEYNAYHTSVEEDTRQNHTNGLIDAATYDQSTILTYETYYGRYWEEDLLIETYSAAVYKTISWFSTCLDSYFNELSLADFGFTAFTYDRDPDGFDKLNAFIMEKGEFDEDTGAYALTGSSPMGEDLVEVCISYSPESETAEASTAISLQYYQADGAMFSVSLDLTPNGGENRFDFMYATYDGNEYVTKNVAWGYLDPTFYTSKATLTCYEFIGYNDWEDGFLLSYRFYLSYAIKLLAESVMPSIDPSLSAADLGFYFFAG